LKHEILAAGPEQPPVAIDGQRRELRDWWIRSWDPSYREIDRTEIVYDSGVQLGAVNGTAPTDGVTLRTQLIASIERMEPHPREAARWLVEERLREWHDVNGR